MRQASLHRPDVLVVEPGMPDGPTVIRHVLRSAPQTAVLALTNDDRSLHAAIGAGARGYISKDAPAEAVIRAIHCVATGNAILGPKVTARLTELMTVQTAYQTLPLPGLTAREHEVLNLIAAGLPNAAIASRLGVATKTLRNHITAIFTKLNATDREEAIDKAKKAGLGKQPKFTTTSIPA
jgi:DNA-binding NarL/FixJ family response regulator